MILWENKNLCLTGEATKCRGMQNAIAITFETSTEGVRFFDSGTVTGTKRACGKRREVSFLGFFASGPIDEMRCTGASP